jgi:hypothetical protein
MLIIICNDDNKYSHTYMLHIETISLSLSLSLFAIYASAQVERVATAAASIGQNN